MKVIRDLNMWKSIRDNKLSTEKNLGFVPTMGNLHAGHQSLIKRARQENSIVVLSIFINPTQFNNNDDLQQYPKSIADDLKLARNSGVDYVLLPQEHALYPDGFRYQVSETVFSRKLCGKHRPGHFTGVLTVILKLLQLVRPSHAYFGEKDRQQLQLIQGMVEAFFIDTKIVACPTIRDENGLALSSRNRRLSAEQYRSASQFPQLLANTKNKDCAEIRRELEQRGFVVDYVQEWDGYRYGAVTIGSVRLIDNWEVTSS